MTIRSHSHRAAGLLALLAAAGCSGGTGPALPAASKAPVAAVSPAARPESASIYINFSSVVNALAAKAQATPTPLPLNLDHAIATLTNSGGLLSAPQQATVPFGSFSAGNQASAVFSGLTPGAGYTLQVSLYDAQSRVVDRGQAGPFTLTSGANTLGVAVVLTSGTSPTLQFLSGFLNSTSSSTWVVAGDTLTLNSGVTDAKGVVGRVELWLDGTQAAGFKDGTLLFTWRAPNFATPFVWNTSGISAQGFRAQSGATATTAPNHSLTFIVYDSLSAPPNDVISSTSFPLTVLNPAGIDVRIHGPSPGTTLI